jgi:hypothetical protein
MSNNILVKLVKLVTFFSGLTQRLMLPLNRYPNLAAASGRAGKSVAGFYKPPKPLRSENP